MKLLNQPSRSLVAFMHFGPTTPITSSHHDQNSVAMGAVIQTSGGHHVGEDGLKRKRILAMFTSGSTKPALFMPLYAKRNSQTLGHPRRLRQNKTVCMCLLQSSFPHKELSRTQLHLCTEGKYLRAASEKQRGWPLYGLQSKDGQCSWKRWVFRSQAKCSCARR